ncbi:AAA family ATPase [Actinosynnema sp. NPDC023587]|uniref:AAA family ATPase n=1 Tax=Actinosynnema sp. NPDC023587 TaxID=3154695 RepID=UPI00340F2A9A
MDRIADRLFVSDFETGAAPPRPGFAVLNASRGVHATPVGAADYRHLPLLYIDDPGWWSTLDAGATWIEFWRDDRGLDVLVHCRAGLDRSVAYVVAYLVRQGMEVDEALATVRAARAVDVRVPDPDLVRGLRAWAVARARAALPAPGKAVPGVMVVGTTASIGKSFLTTALARHLSDTGLRVGVFKTLVTAERPAPHDAVNGEPPEGVVVAALAARRPPHPSMSPVVLHPAQSHVDADNFAYGHRFTLLVDGAVFGEDLTWADLVAHRATLEDVLVRRYREIALDSDIVVVEGAGALVEPHNPLSALFNLRFAERVDARTLVVGDVYRGGGAAAVAGSLAMVSPAHRATVLGTVLNRAGYGSESEYARDCGVALSHVTGTRFLGAVSLLDGVGRIALHEDPAGKAVTWDSVLPLLPAHVLDQLSLDLRSELSPSELSTAQ